MVDFNVRDIQIGNILIPINPGIYYGKVTNRTDRSFFVEWTCNDLENYDHKAVYPFDLNDLDGVDGNRLASWNTLLKFYKVIQDEKEILAFLIKLK